MNNEIANTALEISTTVRKKVADGTLNTADEIFAFIDTYLEEKMNSVALEIAQITEMQLLDVKSQYLERKYH